MWLYDKSRAHIYFDRNFDPKHAGLLCPFGIWQSAFGTKNFAVIRFFSYLTLSQF